MAKQSIVFTTGIADTLYSGGQKINENFDELYNAVSTLETNGTIQPDNLDFIYHSLLLSTSFEDCYYDIFREENTVTLGGLIEPVHHLEGHYYSGYNGSALWTQVVSGSTTQYSFYSHVEVSDGLTIQTQYSTDGITYVNCNSEDVTIVEAGFTNLWLKIIWLGTGNIDSFGVAYTKNNTNLVSKTRFLTTSIAPSAGIPSGTNYVIPENNYYTTDEKSLDVYLNGIRQAVNIDYREIDSSTIKWLTEPVSGDVIVCSEQIGYVDIGNNNRIVLLAEHNSVGNHSIPDIVLGNRYGLKIVGTETLIVNDTTPTYSMSNTITRGAGNKITQIDETSSLGTRTTTYTYNTDNNITIETLYVNGSLVKTTTYTYSGNNITGWSVSYNV